MVTIMHNETQDFHSTEITGSTDFSKDYIYSYPYCQECTTED